MLKVTRYTPTLDFMVTEFKPGDQAAIVFVDTMKLNADMKGNDHYYVNHAKIATHKDYFKKGLFEAPIVVPRGGALTWVEGLHQMAIAADAGLPVVPVITTEPFVAEIKRLVGATNAEQHKDLFDLSACKGLAVHY